MFLTTTSWILVQEITNTGNGTPFRYSNKRKKPPSNKERLSVNSVIVLFTPYLSGTIDVGTGGGRDTGDMYPSSQ